MMNQDGVRQGYDLTQLSRSALLSAKSRSSQAAAPEQWTSTFLTRSETAHADGALGSLRLS